MGMSVDTLQNYKILADMISELDELVTTGIVTKALMHQYNIILLVIQATSNVRQSSYYPRTIFIIIIYNYNYIDFSIKLNYNICA